MSKESDPVFLPADNASDAIELFRRSGTGFFSANDVTEEFGGGVGVYRVTIRAERVVEAGKASRDASVMCGPGKCQRLEDVRKERGR